MKPKTLLWCATLVAACASIAPPTAAETDQLASARELLQTMPDRAADAAEAMLMQNPELRGARLLMAESSLAMARSPDFQLTQANLLDAERNFLRALDGVEDEPYAHELRLLAETSYELQKWQQGSDAARSSAEGYAARKGLENQKEYARSRLIGARCDYRMFIDKRKAELDGGEADRNGIIPAGSATMALATITTAGYAESRLEFPAEAVTRAAEIHRWLNQNGEAAKAYERGLIAHPEQTAIHDAYINWMCDIGQQDALVGAYRRFVREKADAPVLRWHQGRAIYRRADRLRREGNFQGAIAIYQKARGSFDQYLARMPQHRPATNQWQALCDLSMSRCAADTGDLEAAEEHLFRAGETSPAATTYIDGTPQLTDSYGNHFTGAAFAIHMALTQSPEQALERTLKFNEAVCQSYPDRWGFLYNNAALAARDLGVQVANGGNHPEAMKLWERSYQHYEKAVELSPTDARIVNDCGLMLIYHLDRDFDRARAMFDRAIEIGTEQLAELPESTSERDRQLLEEAVGDAWQNIAVLLRKHQKAPFGDYKRFCEEAIKYYPYQRREAAALLRNQGKETLGSTSRAANGSARSSAGSSSAGSGRAATSAGQGGAAEALKKAMPDIEKHAANEDYDSVLNVLDKLSKDCKQHAPYHLMRGEMTWKLANQARDSGRRGTELFYQDAVRAFQRAVELDSEPVGPRQMLAQAQYDAGETQKATDTISSLLLHMQSQGGGKDADKLAAHTLRANAAARAYAQAKNGGDNNQELLTSARTSMRWLEQKGKLDAGLLNLWSTTEQWAEAPAEAVNVFVRASDRNPTDFGLLELVVNTAASQKQLPLAIEALKKRKDAGTIWYRGKAQFYLAGDQRQATQIDTAIKTLDDARKSFNASMQANAGYRDSCEQWIAMCIGKQGSIAFATKKFDLAEKLLLEAARLRPDRINEDLGLLETTKLGIQRLIQTYYEKNDLKKLESISRAASDACNSDVDFLNNSGLFARDYGVQLKRGGKDDEAKGMFEQSYKAYRRAQQLDPKNVRLRNDCALIAIYHLERDWDEVKALLDAAIKDGNETLENSPPDNEEEKQQLEEAVGDCYENLALWLLKHKQDGASAKTAATKSMDYYPGERRGGARAHLRRAERLLQGK